MRKLKVLLAALLSLITIHTTAAATNPVKKAPSRKGGLAIKVSGGGWGNAQPQDIETLLQSTAAELWAYFPQRELPPIVVVHEDSGPKTLYEKGPAGEYIVRLSASDQRWSQYAYQFAHEFCHILSNYDHRRQVGEAREQDQWFEEALCETASLYTLEHMAKTWAATPPYPQWTDYAPALQDYADNLRNEGHRRLPLRATLAGWFSGNRAALDENPYHRDRNEVVANLLLPLFEAHPEHWEAIGYLNPAGFPEPRNFAQYLDNWRQATPEKHRLFIGQVIEMFGLEPPDTMRTAQESKPGPV